jgi:hypothetical protein
MDKAIRYPHLQDYMNCHEGEGVIVFAPGKSIDNFGFLPEFNDCFLVGVNHTIAHPLFKYRNLDYFFIQDEGRLSAEFEYASNFYIYDNLKVNYSCFSGISDRLIDVMFRYYVPYELSLAPVKKYMSDNNRTYILESNEDIRSVKFSDDITKNPIYSNSSIMFPTLQILLSMGFKKIYLVGVDMGGGYWYGEKDRDLDYVQKLKSNRSPAGFDDTFKVAKFDERWLYFKEWVDSSEKYNNVEIISINPEGLVGLFEDKYI